MADWIAWVAPVAAVIGFGTALIIASWVLKQPAGNEKMIEISKATQEGALAFLKREYTILAVFVAIVAVILGVAITPLTAVAFITGAVLSACAGFFGMYVATRANSRTAQAATHGVAPALNVAFRSGLTMGLAVASFGLFGISMWIIMLVVTGEDPLKSTEIVNGFAMGASSIALFARVGGGIYTKAADVGADLVGKVEAGIPEDDPRNPAVIADNVGDNVGDVAGMGADLFESYVGSILAPVVLAVSVWAIVGTDAIDFKYGVTVPLLIAAFGIIMSIIGCSDRARQGGREPALRTEQGHVRGCRSSRSAPWPICSGTGRHALAPTSTLCGCLGAVVLGLLAGISIGKITEYYTSDHYRPGQEDRRGIGDRYRDEHHRWSGYGHDVDDVPDHRHRSCHPGCVRHG